MPLLPLHHPDPFSAIFGIMLYPCSTNDDVAKAQAFTSSVLSNVFHQQLQQGREISAETLTAIFVGQSMPPTDLAERWDKGLAAGQVFYRYFCLAQQEPNLASWNNAEKLADQDLKKLARGFSPTRLKVVRRQFNPVIHLWAAWHSTGGPLSPDAEDSITALETLLIEAQGYLEWALSWQPQHARATPPLSDEPFWVLPKHFRPKNPPPGWPNTVQLGHSKLSAEQIRMLKPAGRPKKTS